MQFSEYIKENLKAGTYIKLAELMNLTKTKTTQIINKPKSMTKQQLIRLAEILEISPLELMNNYNCGHCKINIEDAAEIGSLEPKFQEV